MKKILLVCVCIAFVLYSCNKNSAIAPTSYISATINGTNEMFGTIDSGLYRSNANSYSVSLSALSGTTANADKMELYLANPTQITTGTYALTTTWNPPFEPLIIYKINGSSNFADDFVVDYTGNHPAQITITSISSTNIQGTFSATLVAADNSGNTKTITNGTFNVDIK
jgi:hypothetical protein